MANDLGMMVRIQGDASQLVKEMGKAGKSVDDAALTMGNAANLIKGGLASLGAVASVGVFAGMVKSAIDAADNLNDLSQRIGIGIKELASYELAAKQSGTSLEAVGKGVKNLAAYMVDHADRLKAVGIESKRSTKTFLLCLCRVESKHPPPFARTAQQR